MYKVMLESGDRATLDEYESSIMQGLDLFNKELEQRGGRFFSGTDHPGMLDYMIWPWCERADLLPLVAGNRFALSKDRFKNLVSIDNNVALWAF